MGNIKLLTHRCFSYLIDFFLLYTLSYVGILMGLSVYSFSNLFFVILFFLYSLFSSLNQGVTVGRSCFHLEVTCNQQSYCKWRIFFRDFICQWGFFYIFPTYITHWFSIEINDLWFPVFFIIINLICFFLSRSTTLMDMLSGTKILYKRKINRNKPVTPYFSLFFANCIDLALVFSLTVIFNRILILFVYIEIFVLFFIVSFLYTFSFYLLLHQTPGKILLGIRLSSKTQGKLPYIQILKRELFYKMGFGILLPGFILYFLGWNDLYYMPFFLFFIYFYVRMIYFAVKKESWIDSLAHTCKIRKKSSKKRAGVTYLSLLCVCVFSYGFLLYDNNKGNFSQKKLLGFNQPFKQYIYPDNAQIQKYSSFLSKPQMNPKDYILELFEHYDIVVLCESLHREDTQWDMIYDLVSDKRFIDNVGNIFTEYGCSSQQAKVDTFLQTSFVNEESLEKAAATLMNYFSGNFYFFMKKINLLNQSLPDSLKIKEHFTDIMGWRYFEHIYQDGFSKNMKNVYTRDRHMAQVVIDWYSTHQKKCLVVTNYRHAFIMNEKTKHTHPKTWKRWFTENEAQYIYDTFPDKTANVMIYGQAFKGIIHSPIQQGKWKRAFKNNLYKPVGFNLDGSPFGEDYFDYYPNRRGKTDLKYKNMFTGFVFVKPEEEYTTSSPLYRKYAANIELEENSENLDPGFNKEALVWKKEKKDISHFVLMYQIFLYNYIDILFFVLANVLSFCIATLYFLKNVFQQK